MRLLIAAVGLSALGDWLALVPLSLELEASTNSGIAVAALYICVWAPSVVLAGPAGLAVDRIENTRLLAVASALQALAALALAFAGSTVAILLLALALGSAFAIAQTAEFALIPAIAGEQRLARANGYVETARYAGFTVGPVLGGVLAASGGTEVALLINAGTFGFVAAVALGLHAKRVPATQDRTERARDGVVFLFRDPALGLVIAVAFFSLLFFTASMPAEVFFATDVLEIGGTGLGVLFSCWTLGMVLGSVAVAPRIPGSALVVAALLAIVVQGLGIAAPTLWLVPGFAFAMYLVGGVGQGAKNVAIRTLIHVRTPDRLRGRAYAAYNGIRNAAELFALGAGGAMVAVLGGRGTLFLAGVLPMAVGLAGLAWYRRRARAEPAAQLA